MMHKRIIQTTEQKNILADVFNDIGKKYGYSVKAEYAPFSDLKITWKRSHNFIDFQVSDYLINSSEEVLKSLADNMFAKIKGIKKSIQPKEFCKYIMSDDFIRNYQHMYLRRSKIVVIPIGKFNNLIESYHRLIDAGFVDRDDNLILSWSVAINEKRMGICSPSMHVILINNLIDRENLPDYVLDYIVFEQIIRMTEGMASLCSKKQDNVDKLRQQLASYPNMKEAVEWINNNT